MPSEIFIPRHFKKKESYLMTQDGVWSFKDLENEPSLRKHFILKGINGHEDSGDRLFVHNSFSRNSELREGLHFALIFSYEKEKKKPFLNKLRKKIKKRVHFI